ncbi:MAG: hypothetical protein FWF65_07365 [Bacteroidetes bacterium]|nr:hypothetical protein [Bacteroidota bacterium]
MVQKRTIQILLYGALLIFILLALSKSFKQYSVAPLDGDIAESVLPYPDIQKTFDDPTGVKTIIHNDKHLGVNRFFSHYFLHKTFREIPLLFQKFCIPINSVYYTSAIARLIMQILILCLLAMIISGKINLFSFKFIVTTAILIPFFQTNGKYLAHEIGIMDKDISYCFFYALPLIFLLLYYIPIIFELLHHKRIKMNILLIILWSLFAIISCFSGPLNAPIILITNFILFLFLFHRNWKTNHLKPFFSRIILSIKEIDKRFYFFLFPIAILALYSSFLGTYNNAYSEAQLSLKELYLILPKGILKSFTTTSYSIFLFLFVANYLFVYYKYRDVAQSKKIFGLYRFLIVFSLIYILLLPFGGYRPYRPFILRYDTILPITVLSIITICYTSIFILTQLQAEKWKYYPKTVYVSVFFLILLFFVIRNKTYVFNECEKSSLYLISQSEEDIIALQSDCCVISWEPLQTPEESKNYGELLYLWKITDKPKLYYNVNQ